MYMNLFYLRSSCPQDKYCTIYIFLHLHLNTKKTAKLVTCKQSQMETLIGYEDIDIAQKQSTYTNFQYQPFIFKYSYTLVWKKQPDLSLANVKQH